MTDSPDPPYGPACCVACGGSSLRSMADTPSVVTPCRLASGTVWGQGDVATHGPHAKQKFNYGFGIQPVNPEIV